MRRLTVMILAMLFCLFGCSKEEGQLSTAIDFRSKLVQANGCSFEGEITADYGDSIQSFRLTCDCDAQGIVRMNLLEPETLEGIAATVTEGGRKISYDGLIVDLSRLAQERLAPAAAPGLILESWLCGFIQWGQWEEGISQVSYEQELGDARFNIVTFFKNDLPFSAEVCYNNERVLEMKIEEFQFH